MLLLGTMLRKRALLLPWLLTDLVVLALMVTLFLSWTFLSFFVDLLIAIGKPLSYTVKKVSNFSVPSRDVTYQTLPGRE